jgi:hypothetical protein
MNVSCLTVDKKRIRMRGLSEFEIEKKQGYRLVEIQIAVALTIVVPVYLYTHSWNTASNYQPHSVLRGIIRNSVERFFVVVLSLSVAMGVLKLPAAAVLSGFVVGLVVPIVARILMIKR